MAPTSAASTSRLSAKRRCGWRRTRTDAAAMTLLGELYNQGLGVPQDPVRAVEWYRLAAQRGDPHALASLGLMALDGRGMAKNPGQGAPGSRRLPPRANPGHLQPGPAPPPQRQRRRICAAPSSCCAVRPMRRSPDAQHALGVLYLKGRGVARNPAAAARWFERAAENGSLGRRGRICHPALQRRRRRREREPRRRGLLPARRRQGQRHRPEPPRPPSRRGPRRARRTRSRPPPGISWRAAQGLADTWLDDALQGSLTPTSGRAPRSWQPNASGMR